MALRNPASITYFKQNCLPIQNICKEKVLMNLWECNWQSETLEGGNSSQENYEKIQKHKGSLKCATLA